MSIGQPKSAFDSGQKLAKNMYNAYHDKHTYIKIHGMCGRRDNIFACVNNIDTSNSDFASDATLKNSSET
jgi:hypothetical protein